MKKTIGFLFVFFAFYIGNTQCMEDPNKSLIHEDGILDQFTDLKALNKIANFLLLQDAIFERIACLRKLAVDLKEWNALRREAVGHEETHIIQEAKTPESLSLMLTHPRLPIFACTREDSFALKNILHAYPGIEELVGKWETSDDKTIAKIAEVTRRNLTESKIYASLTLARSFLIEHLLEGFGESGVYQDYKKQALCFEIFDGIEVSLVMGLFDKFSAFHQFLSKPDIVHPQEIVYHIGLFRDIHLEYQKNRSCYEQTYKKIYELLKKSNKKYLLQYSHSEKNNFGISRLAKKELPQSFVINFDSPVKSDKDSDDWIPQHIRILEKKKQPPKGKKGKPKAKGTVSKKIDAKSKKQTSIEKPLDNKQNEEILEEAKMIVSDGSSFLQETDSYLEFDDPKNKLVTRILKTAQKGKNVTWDNEQIEAIEQTDWVRKWYDNPNAALEEQGYTTLNSKKYTHPDNYWKTIAYHSPALILKSYLKRLAQQDEIQNRRNINQLDTVFTVPGIQFYNDYEVEPGKKWESGIFAWIVDGADNKTNYHVEFRPTTVSKIAYDWLQKGYFELNFPTLGEIAQYNKK